jgi:hypothetical protein
LARAADAISFNAGYETRDDELRGWKPAGILSSVSWDMGRMAAIRREV